jgi:hypothetical protein
LYSPSPNLGSKTVTLDSVEYTKTGFHLVWPKIWITVEKAKGGLYTVIILLLYTGVESLSKVGVKPMAGSLVSS